jgi:hypothetical protein
MDKIEITNAVRKAAKGIDQYIEIMELLPTVDVSNHAGFQKKYNAFYRVRQRPISWYQNYYSILESSKKSQPTFEQIIDKLNEVMGRYEPSFSSKLVSTIDPSKPIWDIHILKNTGHTAPPYNSKDKIQLAKKAYLSIEEWYKNILTSDNGKMYIDIFDELVPHQDKITNLKKIDFILWQTRN